VYALYFYLTGYDAQPMYVRDLLSGVLPRTASDGQDPTDTISPQGPSSQDINFASCTGQLPQAPLVQATVDHIRNSLTGAASAVAGGLCASKPDGTRIARGYITVDTVSNCTTKLPSDVGYFVAGGFGDATNQNVLWGDAIYTNHLGGQESGDGSPLVHIRADATDPATSTPGRYTFYGRLVGWNAADNREPLSTTFAVRYVSGGAFSSTNLTVWRDAKVSQTYFACSGNPSWYPLGQEGFSFFDEQEQVLIQTGIPFAPQPPSGGVTAFPAGTQRVAVGSAALATPYPFGWLYLNLNTTVAPAGAVPPFDPAAAQAWVEVHMQGTGRYSVGWPSAQLDSAKGAAHFYPH